MPRVIGPDFVSLQAEDLGLAKVFYGGLLGLRVARETPDAVVFATPVPFAVRKPLSDLSEARLGAGVGLWFGVEDAQGLHDRLAAEDVPVLAPPARTPFGLAFTVRDPFGYAIVLHEVAGPEDRP